MGKKLSIACLCVSLAACGGAVTSAPEGAGGAGAGGGAATGGGSAVTGGGSAGAGGGGECVPQPEGTGGFMEPTCQDLGLLTVTDPTVTDDGGDGLVEAGEGATLQVNLNEVAGVGFLWYPGVIFESDNPGVTLSGQDWLYAILACQTQPLTGHATFDVPAGTTVTITARVAMLNQDCPDAAAIEFPVSVH
jgi:hypothetical protein